MWTIYTGICLADKTNKYMLDTFFSVLTQAEARVEANIAVVDFQ